MRRYAFSALLLLVLPALVLVVMSQAPAADVSSDTGQPPDPASLNAVAAGTPIVMEGANTITQTTVYTVTNLFGGETTTRHQFYENGYPGGAKLPEEFSGSLQDFESKTRWLNQLPPAVQPNDFRGQIVVSGTNEITASAQIVTLTPTPGDTYLASVHNAPTPTPIPTATPLPEPEPTGIFYQISESYRVDDSTAFWLYFWGPEGRGNPAGGSIYVKICIEEGDHEGTCVWSANGHNGGTGELVVWLSYDDAWESEGTVTLYRSEDGSRPDEDADPISRGFNFDTEDTGSTVGMEFQECTTASTNPDCDPSNWSMRSSIDVIEGELLSPEAFDAWIDSLRQQ